MISYEDKKKYLLFQDWEEGKKRRKKKSCNLIKTLLSTKLLSEVQPWKYLKSRDIHLTNNLPLCRFLHNWKLQPDDKIFSKQRMAERVWTVLVYKLEEEGFFRSETLVLPLSSVFLPIFSSFVLKQLQIVKSVSISVCDSLLIYPVFITAFNSGFVECTLFINWE